MQQLLSDGAEIFTRAGSVAAKTKMQRAIPRNKREEVASTKECKRVLCRFNHQPSVRMRGGVVQGGPRSSFITIGSRSNEPFPCPRRASQRARAGREPSASDASLMGKAAFSSLDTATCNRPRDASSWSDGPTAFFMRNVRFVEMPALPWFSDFEDLNVRTHVYDRNNVPGIWFYSLDCNSATRRFQRTISDRSSLF